MGKKVAGLAASEEVSAALAPPKSDEAELSDTGSTPQVEDTTDGPSAARVVDEAEDHARVEDLTRKLHADPSNDFVVDELTTRLLRLGRTHELFALLSARLDEAGPERRQTLLPKQREVLRRLEEDALLAGRTDEVALFREALENL